MWRLLTKAGERLEEHGRAKLLGLLRAGDPRGEVTTAWHAKEAVRTLYCHTDGSSKQLAFGFTRFRNYRIRTLLYAGRPNWSLLATIRPR